MKTLSAMHVVTMRASRRRFTATSVVGWRESGIRLGEGTGGKARYHIGKFGGITRIPHRGGDAPMDGGWFATKDGAGEVSRRGAAPKDRPGGLTLSDPLAGQERAVRFVVAEKLSQCAAHPGGELSFPRGPVTPLSLDKQP